MKFMDMMENLAFTMVLLMLFMSTVLCGLAMYAAIVAMFWG